MHQGAASMQCCSTGSPLALLLKPAWWQHLVQLQRLWMPGTERLHVITLSDDAGHCEGAA